MSVQSDDINVSLVVVLLCGAGAIARGSYIVPTANPLLDKLKKAAAMGGGKGSVQTAVAAVAEEEGEGEYTSRDTMTLQQTLQSVQFLTQRAHANKEGREEGRDNVSTLKMKSCVILSSVHVCVNKGLPVI
jgi:hypothetical protein